MGEGSFELVVTSIERNCREDEETFEVVDDTMAERVIELLNRGLVIQDEAANRSMEGLDVQHQTMETLEVVLESIMIRLLKPSGEPVDDMVYQLNLSTPKKMSKKATGTPAVQLAMIEVALEKDEDMESDNEAMRKKLARKGKGRLNKEGATLDMLNKKIEIFGKEVEPRKFDEVRSNLFATYPPSGKLEDSQRGWS